MSPIWEKPPGQLTISQGIAHVWLADLHKISASGFNALFSSLSEDELIRANKFRFEKDRNHFIAARGILRHLLGRYLNLSPSRISFSYGKFGKPALGNDPSLKFNLSHSGNKAMFGFMEGLDLGVDIEFIQEKVELELVARHFFSADEVKRLFMLSGKDRLQGFFYCWTRKEAFIKAKGSGLTFPLDQFEVTLKPGEPARLLKTHWNPKEKEKWSLISFEPADGYVGALAVEGQVDLVECWHWNPSL